MMTTKTELFYNTSILLLSLFLLRISSETNEMKTPVRGKMNENKTENSERLWHVRVKGHHECVSCLSFIQYTETSPFHGQNKTPLHPSSVVIG